MTKGKKIKTGKVEIPASDFKDENVQIRISMMIPMLLYKDLKRLSLTEEHGGKYQVLIKDILADWVSKQSSKKKHSA